MSIIIIPGIRESMKKWQQSTNNENPQKHSTRSGKLLKFNSFWIECFIKF